MELAEISALLSREPLPLEMGVKRLPSGVLHVASRAEMPRCKGAMLDWWFGWFHNTEHYKWWHPLDHKFLEWDEVWKPGAYYGATCIVDESLDMGHGDVVRLHIKFHDPADIFDAQELQAAYDSGTVAAIVPATLAIGPERHDDENGDPIGGRFIHVAYDTPAGCVLRSRFWLGDRVPAPADVLNEQIPEQLGINLMQHANVEYSYLARVLPNLYNGEKESADTMAIAW